MAVEALAAPAHGIGKYFGAVSGFSSLIAVAFITALTASGAPESRPDLAGLARYAEHFGVGDGALLALASVAVGLVLHPLQFATTQLLEGYWGASRLARQSMAWWTSRHTTRWERLVYERMRARSELDPLECAARIADDNVRSLEPGTPGYTHAYDKSMDLLRARSRLNIDIQQLDKALDAYPNTPDDLMPTSLGNALRRVERESGTAFGFDAVRVIPYMARTANDVDRDYLNDSRSALDLAVRMVMIWTLCTAAAALMLWPYDYWMLVPFATSGLAWIAYRGAVHAAFAYGNAMSVFVALGRRSLYEGLGLPLPTSLDDERDVVAAMDRLLSGDREVSGPLRWSHESVTSA